MALVALAAVAHIALRLAIRPSTDRDWSPDMAVLARAEFSGDSVTIRNIRNIRYRSIHDYDVRHYDNTFDLRDLKSVWFVVEPFKGYGAGAAHTLVSFGFAGGDYVAISVELRRERGETFSPVLGLLRQYELAYVIADERDVIGLRANHRKDDVFLYPVNTGKDAARRMFVAPSYDVLIDAPLEIGTHAVHVFEVGDRKYELAIWGEAPYDAGDEQKNECHH